MKYPRAFQTSVILLLFAAMPLMGSEPEEKGVAPSEAITRLKAGNARFVSSNLTPRKYREARKAQVKGQKPYAVILGCADSRLSPEIIFDESIGRLFVVRVAGNVVSPEVLGSVEYAVEHLHARLVVVLGHESCGAVKATLEGGEATPNIESLIERIMPAARKAKDAGYTSEKEMLAGAVEENVRQQISDGLRKSPLLAHEIETGEVQIIGGVYSLSTSKVEFLDEATGKPVESKKKEKQKPAGKADSKIPTVEYPTSR